MSTYDWLLFLHITGAFLFTGGVFVARRLNMRRSSVSGRARSRSSSA